MPSELVHRLWHQAGHGASLPDRNRTAVEAADRLDVLEKLLFKVHDYGYEIEEELEIEIRQALGLPLGDEDED
jgi:hypothetical protein